MHRNSFDHSRIVYKNIDHSDLLLDIRDHFLYRFLVRNIADITVSIDPFFFVCGKSAL